MPDYQHVILGKDPIEHIARLTINRPDRRNALNDAATEEMGQAIEEVDDDDDIRVLILTGAGSSFCAGGDLNTLKGGNDPGVLVSENSDDIRRGFRGPHKMILGLQRMEKPVIAMINGTAVGAGFDIACACDIRIASPRARFMVAYVRIGLFPGFGGTWFYPRTLGSLGKAAEMLFTGDFMEADEAYRLGVLNRLVPVSQLEEETMTLARRIADRPPIPNRLIKGMVHRGQTQSLEEHLEEAAQLEILTLTSKDHQEALRAFLEKSQPHFEGH